MPDAVLCVPCLQRAGDVPVLKRFDELTKDGDRVETFFTDDRRIQEQLFRTNIVIADEDSFSLAVGDDSHLSSREQGSIDVARNMSEAFEDEDETEAGYGVHHHYVPAESRHGSVYQEAELVAA